MISVYGFAYDVLAKTLLDLGADAVAAHHPHGHPLLSGMQPIQDPWVAQMMTAGLELGRRQPPYVGTILTDRAWNLLPPRSSRIVVATLPYGHLVAHLAGFENWASDVVARKLANAIEAWLVQQQNPYYRVPRPYWTPASRFYQGL